MRYRALLVAVFLVLSLAICGVGAEEELTNDSRKTAVAVRITFITRVMITGHGSEFDTVEPSSGLSDVYVFSGGEVRRNRTFEVKWSPSIAIKSVEWLEVYGAEEQQAMEEVAGCSCVLSPSDSLDGQLQRAFDNMVICLEPGTHTLSNRLGSLPRNVTIRGVYLDQGTVHVNIPGYDPVLFAVRDIGMFRIENVDFNHNFTLMLWGDTQLVLENSAIAYLQTLEATSAVVVDSRISMGLSADHDSTIEVMRSELGASGTENSVCVYTKGNASVIIEDSSITSDGTGILATEESSVKVARCEFFVPYSNDYRASDSATIEVEE